MSRNLFWLSDDQWARIEPQLPTDVRGVGRVDTGAPSAPGVTTPWAVTAAPASILTNAKRPYITVFHHLPRA